MIRFLQVIQVVGAVLLVQAAVRGQPTSGNLILSDAASSTGGPLLYSPGTGVLHTLTTGLPGYFPNAVTMSADNSALFVPFVKGSGFNSCYLARVTSGGAVTTLKFLSSTLRFTNGHVLAPDGSFINAGQMGHLLRFDPATNQLTTLANIQVPLNDVALNRDLGTLLAVVFPPLPAPAPGSLIQFDPAFASMTTLLAATSLISDPSGVVQDPATGDFILSRFQAPGLVRIDATSLAVSTLWTGAKANALALTPRGTFLVATETDVREITGAAAVLKTYTYGSRKLLFTGVEEYGSRRIATSGPATPGTTLTLKLSSPRPSDASKIYVLGLSFSTRPAIGSFAGGEVLNLAADTLLTVTAANILPAIFSGFQGALDGQARAQAAVHIPAAVPAGMNLPVHAGGVVLDPGAPGGVSTVLTSVTVVLR